jgi:hypothetical protein
MDDFAAKATENDHAEDASANLADKARQAGRDIQDGASDLANASMETAKRQASDFVDAAKDVASKAGDHLQHAVSEQKAVGANYVNNLADTMRRAAGEFDADIPIAGIYIRKAADQVEKAADSFRSGNFSDLVQGAQSFARNQPTAFLGLAVLAGFGAVRFLKSASSSADSSDETNSSSGVSRQPGAAQSEVASARN